MPRRGEGEELWFPPEKSLKYRGKVFTRRKVAENESEKECLVIIDNKVYDVMLWNEHHPGGDFLVSHRGEDLTSEFVLARHSDAAVEHMKHFCVGELVDGDQILSDVAKL